MKPTHCFTSSAHLWCVAALLSLATIFAGCSKRETAASTPPAVAAPLQKFELLLDWQAEPTYLGVYYARHLGLFKQVGLDVDIIQSWGANAAVASVASGRYKVATASGGATVIGADNTGNILSLGVLYPRIPTVVYGLASANLSDPASLKGKKVGVYPGSVTVSEFKALLLMHGIAESDLAIQSISGADIPLLKSGQVDAVLHYREMSPAAVEVDSSFPMQNGHRTSELVLADHGVKGYGLNLVANKEAYLKDRVFYDRIAQAVFEGYRRACAEPDAAVAAFLKEFPDKDPVYVKESFGRVVKMIAGNYGQQTAQGWDETIDIYRRLKLLKHDVAPKDLLP